MRLFEGGRHLFQILADIYEGRLCKDLRYAFMPRVFHFFTCAEIIFAPYQVLSLHVPQRCSISMKIFLYFEFLSGQVWMNSGHRQWTNLDGHPNKAIQTMINQVNTLLPSLQTCLIKFLNSVTPRHLHVERFSIECRKH